MHTVEKDSWFWFIPLSDDVTIGCVGDNEYMLKTELSVEDRYQLEDLAAQDFKSVWSMPSEFGKLHVAKEILWTKQHAGEGWVLVGDAFGFIDPIYSSGVYFALTMGDRAADAVIAAFEKKDFSGLKFAV